MTKPRGLPIFVFWHFVNAHWYVCKLENKHFILTSLCLFGLFLFSLLFGLFLCFLLFLLLLFLCSSCLGLGVLALSREKLLPDLERVSTSSQTRIFYLFSPQLFNFSFTLGKLFIYFVQTFYLFSLQLFNFSFTSGKLRCLSAKQAPELFAAPRRPEKRNARHTFWEIWHNPRQMLDVQFEKSDWLKYCFRGTATQLNSHYLALRPRFLFGFLESAGNWKVWDCVHLIL